MFSSRQLLVLEALQLQFKDLGSHFIWNISCFLHPFFHCTRWNDSWYNVSIEYCSRQPNNLRDAIYRKCNHFPPSFVRALVREIWCSPAFIRTSSHQRNLMLAWLPILSIAYKISAGDFHYCYFLSVLRKVTRLTCLKPDSSQDYKKGPWVRARNKSHLVWKALGSNFQTRLISQKFRPNSKFGVRTAIAVDILVQYYINTSHVRKPCPPYS